MSYRCKYKSIKPAELTWKLFTTRSLIGRVCADVAQKALIPGSIFQSQTRLPRSACTVSTPDCTTSSGFDVPGSRRAGCPKPPHLPSPGWGARPCLSAALPDRELLLMMAPHRFREDFGFFREQQRASTRTHTHAQTHTQSAVSP